MPVNMVQLQMVLCRMVVVGQHNLVAIQLCIVTPETPGTGHSDKASDEQQHLDTLEKGKDSLEGKPKDPKKKCPG